MGFFLFVENSCTGQVERIENIFPTERAAIDYAQKNRETIVGICTVDQYRDAMATQQEGTQSRQQEVRYVPQPQVQQEVDYQENVEPPRKRRPELPVFRFTKYRPVGRKTFKPETTNGKGVKKMIRK